MSDRIPLSFTELQYLATSVGCQIEQNGDEFIVDTGVAWRQVKTALYAEDLLNTQRAQGPEDIPELNAYFIPVRNTQDREGPALIAPPAPDPCEHHNTKNVGPDPDGGGPDRIYCRDCDTVLDPATIVTWVPCDCCGDYLCNN
jgi:hypothetical protein